MKVIAAITFINHNTKSNDINFESNNDLKIILSSVYISEINLKTKSDHTNFGINSDLKMALPSVYVSEIYFQKQQS